MQLHEKASVCPEFLEPANFVRHRWRVRSCLNLIGRMLIFVFEAMFDGGRIVREVGPGMRPLERYEFERNDNDQQRRGF